MVGQSELAQRPPSDARLVVETMYQVAADPEAWEQLVEVLDEGLDEPAPEIVRDLAISEDIARLTQRRDEGPNAVRRADLGWLLLTSGRKALVWNGAAAEILDGLGTLRAGQAVDFDDPANEEALAQAFVRVQSGPGQVIVKLDRDEDEGPAFAYLTRGAALAGLAGADLPDSFDIDASYALVFPAASVTTGLWTSIRESFGLTPAEVRLARKLRDGRTLQDAAGELSVSINTVRNQLRAIFDKMGLKRQSDLIRALTELSTLAGLIDGQERVRAEELKILQAPPVRFVALAVGRRLAYREYGDPAGKVLLAFHEGLGSSLLPPGTDELGRELGLRVICAERPGFGQSDPREDYSFEGVAADMVELCDRLGVSQVRIGAVLSGAPSALATAIALGERAVKVQLYSGRPPRAPEFTPGNPLVMFRRGIEENAWVLESFFAILRMRLSTAMLERIVRRSSVHSPGDLDYLDSHPETSTFLTAYIGEALARSSRGPADEIRAFRRARNMDIGALRAPLIVWHGEQDHFAPLAPLLAFLGDRASEVHVMPDIGHMMMLKHWRSLLADAAA